MRAGPDLWTGDRRRVVAGAAPLALFARQVRGHAEGLQVEIEDRFLLLALVLVLLAQRDHAAQHLGVET